ncbi:hypothetical protein NDI56_11285 [Haloarcula sp. S1CR25-12]|uniref:Secreted protein n=1 Tax=Haloarcula saliterrae TaxID=2950534 RepID=A0ABU2FCL2_9EURY|nr:hypothetical protein [Haloarcula sp. S1CR25-12]MDS0259976.1 hypothetical protein [Haloarcula sp. S1CR25-12]
MVSRTRLGHLLVTAGVGIALLSPWFGGSTALACPELGGPVYDTFGVHPGGVAITGIDLADGTVEWYDGCNWRTNSFLPLVAGLVVSLAGVVTATRQRLDS